MREPPRIAERLVRWLVGGRDADAVAGDLRESLEARSGGAWWYWRQALSCAAVRLSGHRRMLPGLRQDFTHAVRMMRRNPGYAITAMLCLALALGVTTTLFALLDSVYFRKLPVRDPDRLLLVQRSASPFCFWREYLDLRPRLQSVRAASTVMFSGETRIGPRHYNIVSECVSGNFGDVLQPGIAAGRWFASDSEPAAVLSYNFWRSKLNGDPSVIGREILLERTPLRVVGIAPPRFRGAFPPFSIDLWLPTDALKSTSVSGPPVGVIARLAPGATRQAAEAELRVVDAELRADRRNPRANDPAAAQPISGILWRRGRRSLQPIVSMMSLLCAAVLLIACVNVANLLLSRAAVRERELAIRAALGATRWRLFRARLAESLLIAAGAAALGLVLGEAAGRALQAAMPNIPEEGFRGLAFNVDARTALFLAAASAAAALLFTAASGAGGRSQRRRIYSVAQVALSLTLLVGTGLLLRAIQHVEEADPGFAKENRLTVRLYGSPTGLGMALDRARAMPGIAEATLAWSPLGPQTGGCAALTSSATPRRTAMNIVESNYFAAMRVPLVRGATFSNAPGVLVNEAMARAMWPGDDPIGKLLWTGCQPADRRAAPVAGVVRDMASPLDPAPQPAYYIARRDVRGDEPFSLIVRTAGDPAEWARPLTDALATVSPDLRVYEAETVAGALRLAQWETRWRAALLASIGALAMLLAAIGLYGVVSCSVAQRTREIGVRMAIGAQPGDVQWMFLAEALRLTAVGVAAGLALSAVTVRLLCGFLYGLSPFDPVAFAGASLAWVVIAMLATWWPARRATRVDPLTAIKYD